MMTLAYIGGIFQSEVGNELFRSLLRIYPEGQTGSEGHVFRSKLPLDDPRTVTITALLESNGLRKSPHTTPSEDRTGYYDYRLHRVYEGTELLQFDLLELHAPDEAYHGAERGNDGELIIPEGLLAGPNQLEELDFISAYSMETWLFVTVRVKQLLEQMSALHLTIRPARYWPNDLMLIDWPTVVEKVGIILWELDSDLILPPVSPAMELHDEYCNRVQSATQRARIHAFGGEYDAYPELHYRASDLRALPPFDVARSFENFGLKPSREFQRDFSKLIVSRRFFEFCRSHSLKATWRPVHIDED